MTRRKSGNLAARAARALGASRALPIHDMPTQGPLDLLALRHEVQRRLRSSGGRPSDPNWNLIRQVPFNDSRWHALEKLAESVSRPSRKVSPAQLAAVLIERGLSDARRRPRRRPTLRLDQPPLVLRAAAFLPTVVETVKQAHDVEW